MTGSVSAKFLLGLSLIAAALAAPGSAEVKIGVVDYGRLLEESPQAKAALDALARRVHAAPAAAAAHSSSR